MNAPRFVVFIFSASLILWAGLASAQVPEPAAPVEPPVAPAAEPAPGIPGLGTPADPAALPALGEPPAGMTGGLPDLPNLQVPPPAGMEGLTLPPSQPSRRSSDNLLLKLFDTDGDGILSGDEVEAAPARLWELDRNLNAEISVDELELVTAPRWEQRRRAVRGPMPVEPAVVEPAVPQPIEPVLPGATPETERANFEVYPLRGLNPGQTLAMLQQVLKGHPQARLTYDGRTQSILALAPPSAHAEIRKALADQLEGERRGIPGIVPAEPDAVGAEMTVPVIPRPVPLYNSRAREVLRVVKEVYRSKIVEPGDVQPAPAPGLPGGLPVMEEPVVPPGKMVIGEGAEPNTIVISAEDKLFFEVLDLIERLDESQEPGADVEAPPVN